MCNDEAMNVKKRKHLEKANCTSDIVPPILCNGSGNLPKKRHREKEREIR